MSESPVFEDFTNIDLAILAVVFALGFGLMRAGLKKLRGKVASQEKDEKTKAEETGYERREEAAAQEARRQQRGRKEASEREARRQRNVREEEREREERRQQEEQEAQRRAYEQARAQFWHQVLDVSPHATVDEIRRAYKKKVSQYHPDKVSGLGVEFNQIAEQKTKEINVAYDQAMRNRSS